jgi:hypothetical protein
MAEISSVYKMTINGCLVGAPTIFSARNLATRKEIAAVPDASREQLDEAVQAPVMPFRRDAKLYDTSGIRCVLIDRELIGE